MCHGAAVLACAFAKLGRSGAKSLATLIPRGVVSGGFLEPLMFQLIGGRRVVINVERLLGDEGWDILIAFF